MIYSINITRELCKQGTLKFECSISESSDTKPQGKVERMKKPAGAKEVLRSNNSSKPGGDSRGTQKCPLSKNNQVITNLQPRDKGEGHLFNSIIETWEETLLPGTIWELHQGNTDAGIVTNCDYVCSGCGKPTNY